MEEHDMTDKQIEEIRVRDILREQRQGEPATVTEDDRLRKAVDAMIENPETRKAYVLNGEGKLIGTITLETLMRHVGYCFGVRKPGITSFLKMLAEISDDRVGEAMTKSVKVLEDEMLTNVTKLMVENHLNDLPVVDDEDRLVGELNGLDILRESRKYWS